MRMKGGFVSGASILAWRRPLYFSASEEPQESMAFTGYPEGCPPDDSVPVAGEVYRLVSGDDISRTDFVSHFDRHPGKTWDDPCLARGLSVFLAYDAAARLRKRFKAFRAYKIAAAKLEPTAGLIKQTGNLDHHTWWPQDEFEPLTAFVLASQEAV